MRLTLSLTFLNNGKPLPKTIGSLNPKPEHEKIDQLYSLFKRMDYPFEYIALSQICALVEKAIGPLEKVVQERATSPYPPTPPKELMDN